MTTNSLDSIIRNVLLRKNMSMHFYLDALIAGQNCLRELTMDDLKVVNTLLLPVDQDTLTADLPNDFQDYVTVAIRVGQHLKPLVESNTYNPLTYRSNGTPALYTQNVNQTGINFNNFSVGYFWRTITWNQYGENIGRLFGYNVGYSLDTFQIFRERNQIQLNEQSGITEIVLIYVSDGMNSDAATHIDAYAYQTIESYILWQFKEMNRNYSDGERERARDLYLVERSILRARKSDLTMVNLKRIVQRTNYATPKS